MHEPPALQMSNLRLGPLEELLWWYDKSSPFHFVMAAEYAGICSLSGWRRALNDVQARQPLLRMRITTVSGGLPSFAPTDDQEIPLRIAKIDSDWPTEICRELSVPFDTDSGPLMRAVLLQMTDRAMLVLAVHPSIADGLSLSHVLRDVLLAISGKSLQPLPLTPSQERSLGIPIEQPGVAKYAGQPRYVSSPAHSEYRQRLEVHHHTISREIVGELTESARFHGTTIQGILCAGLIVAGRRISADWQEADVRMLVPASTRGHAGMRHSMRPALSIVLLRAKKELTGTLWDMARILKQRLAGPQSIAGATQTAAAVAGLVATGLTANSAETFMKSQFTSDASISNLGKVDFDTRAGEFEMTGLWGPALSTGVDGEQYIGVNTMNGVMHLTNTSSKPIPGLLAEIEGVLLSVLRTDRMANV